MNSLISVIIPVFNRNTSIGRAIDCIRFQSYSNLEIIVVDDCSTDGTPEIVSSINDSRIRLIRRIKNGGAAAARNDGISLARGEFVAFQDSDDICDLGRLEAQMSLLMAQPKDVVGVYCPVVMYYRCAISEYRRMRTFVRPFPDDFPIEGDLSGRSLKENTFNLPTLLARKKAVLASGGFDPALRNNEDWDFAIRFSRAGKIAFDTRPMYFVAIPSGVESNRSRISRSNRYSAASYIRISSKIYKRNPYESSLHHHWLNAARFLLKIGRPRSARKFLLRSLNGHPVSMRSLLFLLISFFPKSYSRYSDSKFAVWKIRHH